MKRRGRESRGGERERGGSTGEHTCTWAGQSTRQGDKGSMMAGPAAWCQVQEISLITVWCSQWLLV